MKNQYWKTEDRDSLGDRGIRRPAGGSAHSGRSDSSEGMDHVVTPTNDDTPAVPPETPDTGGGTSGNPDPVEPNPFDNIEDPDYDRLPERLVSKKATD